MERRKKGFISTSASVHLDMIRGVAALAVMIGHLRGLFYVDYPSVAHKSSAIKLLYLATGLGHQAVVVFFVLSGFFIASSVIPKVGGESWSWRPYLIARLTRLYLVLVPALLLCVFWDRLGMTFAHFPALYSKPEPLVGAASVATNTTMPIFISNLFYLQVARSPVFGSDIPLWSLSYEFWYYMLFPILLLALAAGSGGARRIGYVALAAAVAWIIGPSIRLYFLIWLAGALVSYLYGLEKFARTSARPAAAAPAAALFIASLVLARLGIPKSLVLSDFAIGAAFTLWLLFLTRAPDRGLPVRYVKGARSLAGISYTLYLVHFPLLFFMRSYLLGSESWQPSGRSALLGLGLFVIVLIYAYAIAGLTEARTKSARKYLSARLGGSRNAP